MRRLAIQARALEQIIEVLKSQKQSTAKGERDALLTQAAELIRKNLKRKKLILIRM